MKKNNSGLKEKFGRLLQDRLSDFEKYFIGVLLIFLTIGIIESLFGFSILSNFLNNQLEWISKVFLVPISAEGKSGIDSRIILLIFIILFAAIVALIFKILKSKIKNKKD
ncbi:hypothetical protein HY449_00650 [Candidatus Pacearchaeota archaeon]|nr:hypothetical protein [Candidatus Pacearchaeota archaeon]